MNLIESLDEPGSHVHDADWESFYKTVERQHGDAILVIDVEIYYCFDRGIIYYGTVPLGQILPHGLAIQPDAVIMLTDFERQKFACDDDVMDHIRESLEAAADEKHHNEGWDKNR